MNTSKNTSKNTKRPGDTFARRVVPAVTLIGASGALLAALDRPNSAADMAAAGPPIATNAANATTGGLTATTVAPVVDAGVATTVPAAPATVDPATGNAVATTAAPVATAAPETTAAPVVAAGGDCGATVLGPTVSTKFGPVQVQASVSVSGYVCSAQGVVWPTEDRKSVDINNQAIPLLDQWAAYQHDASFNVISGATYTSRAYKQSLQAIIDQVVAGG